MHNFCFGGHLNKSSRLCAESGVVLEVGAMMSYSKSCYFAHLGFSNWHGSVFLGEDEDVWEWR